MNFFGSRSLEPEILDDLEIPPDQVSASLDFMVMINRFFGGSRAVTDYFENSSAPDQFSVLDLGSGSGDIPYALDRWAVRCGKEIQITAIDLNPHCLRYAQKRFASPRISYRLHSAFEAESLGRFDYVISSMFFHHWTDDQIVKLLEIMRRQSRRGFLVNDLYRGPFSWAGAVALGALSFKSIVFNDAKLSVRRAFQEKDFLNYRDRLGLADVHIEKKPFFRILLSYHASLCD